MAYLTPGRVGSGGAGLGFLFVRVCVPGGSQAADPPFALERKKGKPSDHQTSISISNPTRVNTKMKLIPHRTAGNPPTPPGSSGCEVPSGRLPLVPLTSGISGPAGGGTPPPSRESCSQVPPPFRILLVLLANFLNIEIS